MNTGLREKTKEPRLVDVLGSWGLREKTKEGLEVCRWSGRDGNSRTVCDAGRLQVLHRWDRGIQSLGRWARTPAQPSIFRPMLVEDSESVKIALQDCLTW